MFTGTVVENFSYVFQLGGQPTLSREQVRNFKQAWAQYDLNRSGYLPKKDLIGFFNQLDGSLELKVHPGSASLQNLKAKMMETTSFGASSPSSPSKASKLSRALRSPLAKDGDKGHFMWPSSPLGSPTEIVMDGMNISRLNKQLSTLDYVEIRRRKHRFERIYNEALILAEQPSNAAKGGIPFSEMLILLAHYKLINDDEALSLEELMERRAMLEKVEDRIETEKIRGILRLIWLRRRYLAVKTEKMRLSSERQYEHNQRLQAGNVPSINIDDSMSAPTAAGPSASRTKPMLSLDLRGIGNPTPIQIADEPMTPPRRDFGQSAQHLSPGRTTRMLAVGNEDLDQPSISVTEDDDGSYEGSSSQAVSPSPSLQELERRASPMIEHIDSSAWGALAKRLSTDGTPRSEHVDGRGDYGKQHPGKQSRSNTSISGSSAWL